MSDDHPPTQTAAGHAHASAPPAQPPQVPPELQVPEDRDDGERYPMEFRLTAVEAVRSGQYGTRPQTAEALGVNYQTLSNWVRELGEDAMLDDARTDFDNADDVAAAIDEDPAAARQRAMSGLVERTKARTSAPIDDEPAAVDEPTGIDIEVTPYESPNKKKAAARKTRKKKPVRHSKHPDAMRVEAVARAIAGESQREVGDAMGINVKTLGAWVVKHRKGEQFTQEPLDQLPVPATTPAPIPVEAPTEPETMTTEIRATDMTPNEQDRLVAEWDELRQLAAKQKRKLRKHKKKIAQLEAENKLLADSVRYFANQPGSD